MPLRGTTLNISKFKRALWLIAKCRGIYTGTCCFQKTFKVAKRCQFHVHLFGVCVWPRCEFCTKFSWSLLFFCIELNTFYSCHWCSLDRGVWLYLIPLLHDKWDMLLFRGKLVVFKNKFGSLGPLAMPGEPRCINLCLPGSGAEALCFVSPLGRVKFSPGVCWHRLWSQWTFPVISGHRWLSLLPEATIPKLIKEWSDKAGSWSLDPKDWQE